MKIGDYVRTYEGHIGKLINIDNHKWNYLTIDCKIKVRHDNYPESYLYLKEEDIKKSSPSIIDLIEVGDYVNGLPVANIEGTRYDKNDLCCWLSVGIKNEDSIYLQYGCIKAKDIKSVVTHEQFEEREYNI